MRLDALGLHVTDACNARCEHCAYHCAPEVKGVMSFEEAHEYLEQVAKRPPDLVCISGGEPCLYLDLVVKIVSAARALNIPNVWIFTNAFWATSAGIAMTKLMRLKRAGMTRLCLSADSFHQAFIPVGRVRNAIQASHNLGLDVVLDSRFLGSPQEDNLANRATQRVLMELGELEGIEFWRGQPRYIGRAAEQLPQQLVKVSGIPNGPCPGPWAGGTWESPAGLDLDSYGEATLCPGLSIGNVQRQSLTKIVNEYNAGRHPIIRELVRKGPAELLKVAEQHGYVTKRAYADECHLCYDLRKSLRSSFPSELAPSICYEEVT
jgi:hypothetical protein